jgi:signal peptidase I
MAELSGALSSFPVAQLVRFLSTLNKTGDLLVWHETWIGLLSFERGRLTAADIEGERGTAALELVCSGMSDGEFEFSEGPTSLEPDHDLSEDPLRLVDRLGAAASRSWLAEVPGPTAVPRAVSSVGDDDTELVLERAAIYLLLDVDGVRTVRDLARRHGLARSIESLARLREDGLIVFEAGEPPPDTQRTDPDGLLTTTAGIQRPVSLRQRLPTISLRGEQRLVRFGIELAQAVVVTGLVVLGLRSVVQNFRVEGISMEPTFDGGQVLVVNRVAYFHVERTPLARLVPTTSQGSTRYVFGGPQRGDVAVFRAPPEPDTDYIKRVIGLPGDAVLISDGHVFINDQRLDEPYVRFPATYNFPGDGQPLFVPDDNYFVLGDNRPDSFDSHTGWLVPVSHLIGRAWIRYWPPNELGLVKASTYASAQRQTLLSQLHDQ